jgi:hypothetical protein
MIIKVDVTETAIGLAPSIGIRERKVQLKVYKLCITAELRRILPGRRRKQ